MIYRAFDLGLIDDGERADLYRKMTKRRWRGPLQEPFDDRISMPLEIPRMMRRGVEALLSERVFGASQIKSELALPDKELEQLLTVHPGFFADAVRSPSNLQIGRPLDAQDLESGKVIALSRKR